MGGQGEYFRADDVTSEEAVRHWDAAAEEFAGYFADGEEYYHKCIINPCVLDLLGLTRRYVSDLYTSFGYPVLGELEERMKRASNSVIGQIF